jgi:hypothetical protein
MKRLLVLTIVSTLVVGMVGCQQCNWFGRPSSPAVAPGAAYSTPAMPMAPATSSPSCGPGCNSCGGNTLPMFSGAQGYTSAPTN